MRRRSVRTISTLDALGIEFEYYVGGNLWHPVWVEALSLQILQGFPSSAIREVMKTLVPAGKWQTIDDKFNFDLRMQAIEYGVYDIAVLFARIEKLLLCSRLTDARSCRHCHSRQDPRSGGCSRYTPAD